MRSLERLAALAERAEYLAAAKELQNLLATLEGDERKIVSAAPLGARRRGGRKGIEEV